MPRTQLSAAVQADLATCDTVTPDKPRCDAGTSAFYAAFLGREPTSEGEVAYRQAMKRGFNPRLYETMWGRSEFVSTGTLRDYDGEPLLAKLDGARTLFIGGQYDEARPTTLAGFAARVPGAEFATIPGAGHGFFATWCSKNETHVAKKRTTRARPTILRPAVLSARRASAPRAGWGSGKAGDGVRIAGSAARISVRRSAAPADMARSP